MYETSREITQNASTDLDKARAIYEWIVDNTFRDPKVRGCGLGDIETMLETRNFGGKCADLNALFVGLTRAATIPARDLYGIRVADSKEFLFGQWEMNYLGYNWAHDMKLPNSAAEPVAFLMYPQAETADTRQDSLDPAAFKYQLTSREITE